MKKLFLGAVIASLSGYVDMANKGDVFRLGKMKAVLLLGALLLVPLLFEITPFSVALFCVYGMIRWINAGYSISGVMDILLPIACVGVAAYMHNYARDLVAKIWVWMAAVQAFYGCLQFFDIQLLYPVYEPYFQKTPLAFMGQQTVLGGYLAACLAPALWLEMWLPSALILLCIALTGSSMAYLSTIAVLVLYFWEDFDQELWVAFGIAAMGALLYFYLSLDKHDPLTELFNLHERPQLWLEAWKAFKENIIFGGGPGYWAGTWMPAHIPVINGYRPEHPHAEWAILLAEYGLVGVFIVLTGLVEFIARWRFDWPQALCAAILVNSLANFPLHVATHGVLFLWAFKYCMEDDPTYDSRSSCGG